MDLFLARMSLRNFIYVGISLRASVSGMVMFKPCSTFTKRLNLVPVGFFDALEGNRSIFVGVGAKVVDLGVLDWSTSTGVSISTGLVDLEGVWC